MHVLKPSQLSCYVVWLGSRGFALQDLSRVQTQEAPFAREASARDEVAKDFIRVEGNSVPTVRNRQEDQAEVLKAISAPTYILVGKGSTG